MFYLGLISLYHLSSLSLQGHKSGHAQCIGNDDMQIHSYTCINNLRTTWYDKPRLCFYAFCIAWSAQNGICLACWLGSPAKSRIKIKTPFCCPVHWLQGRRNIQDHEGYCPHQVLTNFNFFTNLFESGTRWSRIGIQTLKVLSHQDFWCFGGPEFLCCSAAGLNWN